MRNKKKYLIFTALLLAVLLLFAACADKPEEPASDGGNESPQTTADTDETEFSYSLYHDENGMWEGVKALDVVTMGEYIGVDLGEITPPESDVLAEVYRMLETHSVRKEIDDRAVADGDTVNIDYVGSIDGVEFEGGSTRGTGTDVTIGVTQYIDDFLEQLIGHMPGEEIDVEGTFPDDYHSQDLAGKDAVFVTKINYIVENEMPVFNDESVAAFFGEALGVSTADELYAHVEKNMSEVLARNATTEYILANFSVESIPEKVYEYQKLNITSYYESYAAYYGMDFNTFIATMAGCDNLDALYAKYEDDMKNACVYSLAVQAIAEKEGIEISQADIDAFAAENQFPPGYEATIGIPYLKAMVMQDKVVELIVENAAAE
ncbi:MAG TPA: FKBP-type peptidyl-prolyl cis-trans isomerase [Bacillota bacterium]|nr:FKBP-type peptidyl-prolyl cis-trans isomerase [Bacillota bacterium]